MATNDEWQGLFIVFLTSLTLPVTANAATTQWSPAIIQHIHTPPQHPHALSISRSDTNRNDHTTYATPPAWTTTTTTCDSQLATTQCTHPCPQHTHALNTPTPSTHQCPQCTHALSVSKGDANNHTTCAQHPHHLAQTNKCKVPKRQWALFGPQVVVFYLSSFISTLQAGACRVM